MFGFLKEKLKQTIEKLTKEIDQATEKVEPTQEQKKEIISEKKQIQVEEKRIEIAEKKPMEREEAPKEVLAKKIKEGEKEIEKISKKKDHAERKEAKKIHPEKEEKKEEERGFFARLKEKFTSKEEEKTEESEETEKEKEQKAKEPFESSEEELKEFEQAFQEKPESISEKEEEKEGIEEEIIPVVTETEKGETIFELYEKPGKKQEVKREENPAEEEQEEIGFFNALKNTIFKTSLSEDKFEELFWELEMVLLENNVAVEVIELIKQNLKKDLVEKKILRGKINEIILKSLQNSVEQTFNVQTIDFIKQVKEKKPFIVVFVGINGSGKTTTIAKMAQKLKENNLSCVIAAGDTFRAAAIQQLEEHANRLHVKMIKHDYGSDPAAVGFDAIKYAQAHNIDCVLIDTAGRLHSNTNLMDEMKKIIRVTKPDMKIFIGEAITGNDCVDQARKFHEAIGIDGIILAKADVDEKGGAALSISYVTKKPILYMGTGQGYSDLEPFDKEKVMEQIGLV